jgi:hypothetical protein
MLIILQKKIRRKKHSYVFETRGGTSVRGRLISIFLLLASVLKFGGSLKFERWRIRRIFKTLVKFNKNQKIRLKRS